jgi:N-acyl-phosphatidylethanolamine-hydrolysing phospholipase D
VSTPRFADRATRPSRGPTDILAWKLWRRGDPEAADHAALEQLRPALRKLTPDALAAPEAALTWLGHATFCLRLGGLAILTDPIFSRRIQNVVPRQCPLPIEVAALPKIDVVTVSHDHMDHMDFPSLRALGPGPLYVVPLGNAERLRALGLERVIELDWWQSHQEGKLTITLVPARHWSMRMPWTRNDTLWGGFVFRGPEGSAYHAGDTAIGDHYREIGQRLGPIDLAMLPIGAYSPRWFMAPQHQCPEEAGEGFLDLGARRFVAMHWGTFRLTDEPIGEPPVRLRAYFARHQLPSSRLWIPDIGERRHFTAI